MPADSLVGQASVPPHREHECPIDGCVECMNLVPVGGQPDTGLYPDLTGDIEGQRDHYRAAWMRRGRDLNALYDALTEEFGASPDGDPVADIHSLGAERDRLRDALAKAREAIDAMYGAGFDSTRQEIAVAARIAIAEVLDGR